MKGHCPECQKTLTKASLEAIEIGGGFNQRTFHGISYLCPHCSVILSVSIDPNSVKAEVVSEILKALGKKT